MKLMKEIEEENPSLINIYAKERLGSEIRKEVCEGEW